MSNEPQSQKKWRPFGNWALALNAAFGFPALYVLAFLDKGDNLPALIGAYASVLTTYALASGIRAYDKRGANQ